MKGWEERGRGSRRGGGGGGVLLASRPWRLPRRTTHIVASRTKKRQETRRKERSRSTGEKRNGREKRKPMRKGRVTRTRGGRRKAKGLLCSRPLRRLSIILFVACINRLSSLLLSFFRPSVLPSFLSSFLLLLLLLLYLPIDFRSFRPRTPANYYTISSRTPVTFYVFILAPICRLR